MNKTFRRQLAIAAALQLLDPQSRRGSAGQTETTRRQRDAKRKRTHAMPPARYRATHGPIRQMGINE
jgi:hypothetical protein